MPLWASHFASCAAACSATSSLVLAKPVPTRLDTDPAVDARSRVFLERRVALYDGFLAKFRSYWSKRAALLEAGVGALYSGGEMHTLPSEDANSSAPSEPTVLTICLREGIPPPLEVVGIFAEGMVSDVVSVRHIATRGVALILAKHGPKGRFGSGRSGSVPAVTAIRKGSLKCLHLLLRRGCDVNARCTDDLPLAMHAVLAKQPVALVMILNCNPRCARDKNWLGYALNQASERSSRVMAQVLLNAGANVDHLERPSVNRPLPTAVYHGHKRLVRFYLNACGSNALGRVERYMHRASCPSPFPLAVLRGDVRMVRCLLGAGFNQYSGRSQHHLGTWAFSEALDGGYHFLRADILRLLIRTGWSFQRGLSRLQALESWNPVPPFSSRVLVSSGCFEDVRQHLLFPHLIAQAVYFGDDGLLHAIDKSRVPEGFWRDALSAYMGLVDDDRSPSEWLSTHLVLGVVPCENVYKRESPLHVACRRGLPEQVAALIDCGADLDETQDESATAVMIAANAWSKSMGPT